MSRSKTWVGGPSKPGFVPPAGAVDAHMYVCGPGANFAFSPRAKYHPADATP